MKKAKCHFLFFVSTGSNEPEEPEVRYGCTLNPRWQCKMSNAFQSEENNNQIRIMFQVSKYNYKFLDNRVRKALTRSYGVTRGIKYFRCTVMDAIRVCENTLNSYGVLYRKIDFQRYVDSESESGETDYFREDQPLVRNRSRQYIDLTLDDSDSPIIKKTSVRKGTRYRSRYGSDESGTRYRSDEGKSSKKKRKRGYCSIFDSDSGSSDGYSGSSDGYSGSSDGYSGRRRYDQPMVKRRRYTKQKYGV